MKPKYFTSQENTDDFPIPTYTSSLQSDDESILVRDNKSSTSNLSLHEAEEKLRIEIVMRKKKRKMVVQAIQLSQMEMELPG